MTFLSEMILPEATEKYETARSLRSPWFSNWKWDGAQFIGMLVCMLAEFFAKNK
jgi:hypothetical protein